MQYGNVRGKAAGLTSNAPLRCTWRSPRPPARIEDIAQYRILGLALLEMADPLVARPYHSVRAEHRRRQNGVHAAATSLIAFIT